MRTMKSVKGCEKTLTINSCGARAQSGPACREGNVMKGGLKR